MLQITYAVDDSMVTVKVEPDSESKVLFIIFMVDVFNLKLDFCKDNMSKRSRGRPKNAKKRESVTDMEVTALSCASQYIYLTLSLLCTFQIDTCKRGPGRPKKNAPRQEMSAESTLPFADKEVHSIHFLLFVVCSQ